jgi:quinol monooxygenase YgiN
MVAVGTALCSLQIIRPPYITGQHDRPEQRWSGGEKLSRTDRCGVRVEIDQHNHITVPPPACESLCGPLPVAIRRRKVVMEPVAPPGRRPDRRGWIVFARSTTITARSEAIDAGIAHVRDEVMPAADAIDGCVGLSLMTDRESGRCILTTAWRSAEAMQASAAVVAPLRHRVVEAFAGGSATIDEWEIAVVHREQYSAPGACVRATWLRTRPELFDRAVDYYRTAVLPSLDELEGFCSASLMLDRASGRAVSSTTFTSQEAMDRNRDLARSLRTTRLRDLGADQLDVGEFELTLAHLRVPELA